MTVVLSPELMPSTVRPTPVLSSAASVQTDGSALRPVSSVAPSADADVRTDMVRRRPGASAAAPRIAAVRLGDQVFLVRAERCRLHGDRPGYRAEAYRVASGRRLELVLCADGQTLERDGVSRREAQGALVGHLQDTLRVTAYEAATLKHDGYVLGGQWQLPR